MTIKETDTSRLEITGFQVGQWGTHLEIKRVDSSTQHRFLTATGKIADAIMALGIARGPLAERPWVKLTLEEGDRGLAITAFEG